MNKVIGCHDIIFIVLDTLRYDVAQIALEQDLIPNIKAYLPHQQWQQCHSSATFTYPAHHAFFAGFLPTPINHPTASRLFAADFMGSETIAESTWVFKQANMVEALAACDYQTICIGGVGFFNKQNAIGSVFPNLFQQSYWSKETSVVNKNSTQVQVDMALKILSKLKQNQRYFLFINISALHQPNYFYLKGAKEDSIESQVAALAYVDKELKILFDSIKKQHSAFCILCSDHGTCYGEAGYYGHKVAHQVVLQVPYAHFFIG